MNVKIEYKQPSGMLRPYICHYIITEVLIPGISSESLNHLHINIPDGAMEMHFNYHNTTVKFGLSNSDFHTYRSVIIGNNNLENALRQTSLKRAHKCIIVKFKYQGFYELFGIPVTEFCDKIYETEHVFGAEVNKLHDRLDHANNENERIAYIEQFMLIQLKLNRKPNYRIDRCIKAVDIINKCNGNINLPSLIERIDISERPLQRDFKTITGISPKQFCKIARFQLVLKSLNSCKGVNCSDLAYLFGYYDQAHLINEFKKATTVTPEWYLKNINTQIFNIFNTLIFPKTTQFNSSLCQNLVSKADTSFSDFKYRLPVSLLNS